MMMMWQMLVGKHPTSSSCFYTCTHIHVSTGGGQESRSPPSFGHVCAGLHIHMCMHVEARRGHEMLSCNFLPYSLDSVSYWTWSLPFQLAGCLACSWDPSILPTPNNEVARTQGPDFIWVLGSSCLHSKWSYPLSHLLSPSHSLLKKQDLMCSRVDLNLLFNQELLILLYPPP